MTSGALLESDHVPAGPQMGSIDEAGRRAQKRICGVELILRGLGSHFRRRGNRERAVGFGDDIGPEVDVGADSFLRHLWGDASSGVREAVAVADLKIQIALFERRLRRLRPAMKHPLREFPHRAVYLAI